MKSKLYNKYSPYLSTVCLCSLGFFLTSCGSSSVSNPPAMADYGDAPDGGATGYPTGFAQTGQFPSLFASGGAHILDISAASLGPGITEEADAAIVNLDIDDSVTNFYHYFNFHTATHNNECECHWHRNRRLFFQCSYRS